MFQSSPTLRPSEALPFQQNPLLSISWAWTFTAVLFSCMWTHIPFIFWIFIVSFNYQFQCCILWDVASLPGPTWGLPPLCSHSTLGRLLLWPDMHQNHWGRLFPEGSFRRYRSHCIFLCIIGAKPVFGVVVGVFYRLWNEWLSKWMNGPGTWRGRGRWNPLGAAVMAVAPVMQTWV